MRSTADLAAFARVLGAGLLGVVWLGVGGCSGDSAARACTVNADCASGQCLADGTCVVAEPGADGGSPVESGDDAGGPVDGGADAPGPTLDAGLCTSNDDGIITADEVPLRAGLAGSFEVTTSGVTISTSGTSVDGGASRQWDWSAALTGDHKMVLETMPLAGQWFGGDFPGAGYAARLSDATDLLGVFAATPGALELRGIVSPAGGNGQTRIHYDPPIPTLSFPLQMGKTWEVTSTASGDIPVTFNVAYTEKYTFEVDAEGEMKTSTALNPFKVMRVSVLLQKTPSFSVVSYYTRQYVYVAECFGAVAKVVTGGGVDQTTPPPADFTDADEVQRLAP
jgi:hypothetical protein